MCFFFRPWFLKRKEMQDPDNIDDMSGPSELMKVAELHTEEEGNDMRTSWDMQVQVLSRNQIWQLNIQPFTCIIL